MTIITYIHCDRCMTPYVIDPLPKGRGYAGETASEQRRAAHKDGWRTYPEAFAGDGALDYCPDCLKDPTREEGWER